ncbi:MAG: hypothetical protein JSS72_10555 [Armatimonadetes bacterium]|nr:hypothetical protein [Armatimonadota bacterium]
MSTTYLGRIASRTDKVSKSLIEALERIPADKLDWAPAETSRSAIDQFAECAMLNGVTADTIEAGQWLAMDFPEYLAKKADMVAKGPEALKTILKENTARLVTILNKTAQDPDQSVETQFGPMTWDDILGYPMWNMSYHEGQINYIASILGTL